jgi:hypothetical protein
MYLACGFTAGFDYIEPAAIAPACRDFTAGFDCI